MFDIPRALPYIRDMQQVVLNLPELPEGFRWRVSRYVDSRWYVRLQKKNALMWWTVGKGFAFAYHINDRAKAIWRDYQADQDLDRQARAINESR